MSNSWIKENKRRPCKDQETITSWKDFLINDYKIKPSKFVINEDLKSNEENIISQRPGHQITTSKLSTFLNRRLNRK